MLGKVLALSTLCAFVLLSALLQSTTPSTIHPLGILAVFVLLYLLALGVLTFFIYAMNRLLPKKGGGAESQHNSLKRAYMYGSALALAPIMLAGMASIGRTGVYEFILVVLFEIVACFYLTKHR